ncbi:hypothetical protein CRG98_004521 [Punica granatum]|uniref:NB-ARC domain-containing protein n=1 Tax=Punica granatum TaxID=22663 RepID=A0A2I0L2W5_PUNGR|nr:hypothetical protein CRG98_004521 [Punica granatum]
MSQIVTLKNIVHTIPPPGRHATGYEFCSEDRFPRDRVIITYFSRDTDLPRLLPHHVAFQSRAKVLSNIMEALQDGNTNLIGVYGMGGVGKTTLMKDVMKKALEEDLFDDVEMATVSENPDVE